MPIAAFGWETRPTSHNWRGSPQCWSPGAANKIGSQLGLPVLSFEIAGTFAQIKTGLEKNHTGRTHRPYNLSNMNSHGERRDAPIRNPKSAV